MEEREIYPNAPVVLVALEVRHPDAGALSNVQQRKIKHDLGGSLPIQRVGQLTRIEGVIGDQAKPSVQVERFPKYFSRDNTTSISFRNTAVVVETTNYLGWRQLHSLAISAFEARVDAGEVDGVERVGLRYVNEIRVPAETVADWYPWIDASLLGPTQVADKLSIPVTRWQGLTVFNPTADHSMVLRYGLADGYAVDPGGDLKRPAAHTPGPFFLVDIDSFWTPIGGVPEFAIEDLGQRIEALHDPVDDLFEALITDKLREEVLRRGFRD